MRDIEYRGKLSHSGEWETGSLIIANNDHPYIYPKELIEPDGHHLRFDTDAPFWVNPDTVGQYTGLKDKNGVKIFEGDIVQLFDKYHGCTAKGYGKVIFSYEYVGGWVITSNGEDKLTLGIHTDIVEVVGNIHDTPELMEANNG
jgi:uncharacterized phage protein (TIGR01671 family)